jgi:hypothetical protein
VPTLRNRVVIFFYNEHFVPAQLVLHDQRCFCIGNIFYLFPFCSSVLKPDLNLKRFHLQKTPMGSLLSDIRDCETHPTVVEAICWLGTVIIQLTSAKLRLAKRLLLQCVVVMSSLYNCLVTHRPCTYYVTSLDFVFYLTMRF